MPLTRRQIYRRRRIAVFGSIALVLAAGFYLPLTLLAPLSPIAAQVLPITTPVPVAPTVDLPSYGASGIGAIGYPGVLTRAGSTNPLPIASLTKIVTALVVLEAKPLELAAAGPDVRFSRIDEGFYADQLAQGGVVRSVYAGQVMSERNIFNVMLMVSANNYAQSLANWAFGSEAAYVDAARAWLQRHGLGGTTVTDATGVDPRNASTVTDLIQLAKLAIANPVIAEIVATKTMTVPDLGTVNNRNELLGVDGVTGIKTGTLAEAGACLLFSARETVGTQTITLVGVVLGGPDHPTVAANVRSLLAQAVAGFHEVTLATAGTEFARYDTLWGTTAKAVAAKGQSTVLWSNTPVTVAVHANTLRRGTAGEGVGELVFTAGERSISVPLTLSAAIDDPGPWWRLTNPTKLF